MALLVAGFIIGKLRFWQLIHHAFEVRIIIATRYLRPSDPAYPAHFLVFGGIDIILIRAQIAGTYTAQNTPSMRRTM